MTVLSDRGVILKKSLSTPPPIPQSAIQDVLAMLETGRLFRYEEDRTEQPITAIFEKKFASLLGAKYAMAVNSCGCGMFLALQSAGVRPGDAVLTNAFTLAPVPGAIAHAGGKPILVESNKDLTIDFSDLQYKALVSQSKFLLLSHMRGHVPDMNQITAFCEQANITIIEDCAHTLGARWDGTAVGRFGKAACFSTQSFKHLNSGEGGIVITDDPSIATGIIFRSGSYHHHLQSGTLPPSEEMEKAQYHLPNYSMRMSAMTATLLLHQLPNLEQNIQRWNRLYDSLYNQLERIGHLELISRDSREQFVGSSLQFFISAKLNPTEMARFLQKCAKRGVYIKWYGRTDPEGFTSRPEHWKYIRNAQVNQTLEITRTLCDIRIPLTLEESDSKIIASVIESELSEIQRKT